MDVDLASPSLWVSMMVGAALLASVSAFLQSQHEDAKEGYTLNTKALVRDGLLGAIFTAMAWTLVPESMQSLTSSVTTAASSAATTVTTTAASASVAVASGDIDLQIGPAKF